MKKLLLIITLASFKSFGQDFVSPINFTNDSAGRKSVVIFIQKNVKEEYSKIGMDDAITLRMMESENLKAFKELVVIKNTSLLKEVIDTYCGIGMCNYTTILMMYKEQEKASNKTLSW